MLGFSHCPRASREEAQLEQPWLLIKFDTFDMYRAAATEAWASPHAGGPRKDLSGDALWKIQELASSMSGQRDMGIPNAYGHGIPVYVPREQAAFSKVCIPHIKTHVPPTNRQF